MGQKINPKGFRLSQGNTWSSRWFATGKRYRQLLASDIRLREMLTKKLKIAGLAEVQIERSINKIGIIVHVSKPGLVIGRGGSGLEDLKKFVEAFLLKQDGKQMFFPKEKSLKVEVTVEPVKEPNLNAFLVANMVVDQIIRRLPQKRVCNQAVARVMGAGAIGVKILLAGRIGGAEIARREKYQNGTIPLSTLRENVDFASVPALTKSGYVGVKVWICRKSS